MKKIYENPEVLVLNIEDVVTDKIPGPSNGTDIEI